MSEETEPSQTVVNKMLRVLKGTRGKATCTIHLPDGRMIEFQTDKDPQVHFDNEDRCLWLVGGSVTGDYGRTPIMRWPDGAILICEKNHE